MNLHEYQSKQAVPRVTEFPCRPASSPRSAEEAVAAAKGLGGSVWVVKAQVHAGGRGKAGGVKLGASISTTCGTAAADMLGQRLVTKQTGPEGLPIEPGLRRVGLEDRARDLPAACCSTATRPHRRSIASAAGGMDIEEVARSTPGEDPARRHPSGGGSAGLPVPHARVRPGPQGQADRASSSTSRAALYRSTSSATRACVEVNPLIVTGTATLVALDAKINIEDNALFRQKELAALRDPSQEDAIERDASEHDLNYVSLDGDIACMVNGAGLAMATMDLIKLHGGSPANFLDVGGGATRERVTAAFKLILSNPKVHAILVNIFGGIVRCDMIAEGVIGAVHDSGRGGAVVVRIEGTNAEQAREMLAESGLAITAATDLTDAAKKGRRARRQSQSEAVMSMSILVNKNTRVICQGFTGKQGTFHSRAVHRVRHQAGRRRHAGPRR